jgi:putative flippase GtrA
LNVALIWLSERIGLHYLVGAILAFPLVLAVGYLLHARFTFGEKPSVRSFIPYAAAMGLNLPLSWVLLAISCELAGLGPTLAMALITVLLAAWNLISPLLAFRLGRRLRAKQSGAAG